MKHQSIFNELEDRLQQPLPGALAHDVMRATPVGPLIPSFEHKVPAKPGAVLIVLYADDEHIKFPLIKRQEYLGAHSNQVSLPGGKAEPGEDAVETALREGEEEIGINRNDLRVIGKLSDFFVIPSNFIVTPIVAICNRIPVLRPDPREVKRILTGNLFSITQQDAIKNKEIVVSGDFKMMAPHFDIEGEVVWGATAMILNELCEVVRPMLK
ncbi:NUDIX hydrolase [Chryseosolibacter indicus]|uniref:CoA pyrophosphatase n=1 Tax=Chryseosolibacter indicus TaxID=2782351 RepID=A0ABS5VRC4_9BACT|nr:CoA pyrophosphatase [Chryseosolibacter indicus]MBT1703309.1 CoA pyrophosphatase [Chryseosolibacter indicus]